MHDNTIIERCVCRDYHCACPDFSAVGCDDLNVIVAIDIQRTSAAMDFAAIAHKCLRQAAYILQRMKLGLVFVLDTWTGIKTQARHLDQLFSVNAGAACSINFLVEFLESIFRKRIQVAIQAFEFTFDAFLLNNGFDQGGCAGKTIGNQPRFGKTEGVLNVNVPLIRREKVGGGAAGFACSNPHRVNQDDFFTFLG